ncbi:MAG TPA: hypothetical protein VMT19_08240 [Thermoanaerobaculaceae bacterium]|nr:hypothetical protein [Thermoanaerobaculaceae bacterium]
MIVHRPELSESRDGVTASAAVEVETRGRSDPGALWFEFPHSVGEFATSRADAFAAALLPLAMHLGEPLTVHGGISCRLARGLREYQQFQSSWKPTIFRVVELRCDEVESRDPGEGGGGVGTAFSGGVDSFHTLRTHLAGNEPYPPYRISHCLLINGFDSDADVAGAGFVPIQRVYEALMARLGVQLVVVRTNLLQFLGELLLKQSFAAFVTAPALALGRLFSRYYVPSSYRFTQLGPFPDGSHPMFDHLVGTETMETIHDGGHLTRVAKTLAIANWPETHDHLRVCFNATGVQPGRGAIANCCECEKCVRTMATLDVAGVLGNFRCFPKPLVRRNIRRLEYATPGSRVFAEEIVEYAARAGRRDVARDFRFAIAASLLYRRRLRSLMLASYRLEQRAPRYAAVSRPTKRLIQRTGLFRGWLY